MVGLTLDRGISIGLEDCFFSAGELSSFTGDLASSVELSFTMSLSGGLTENLEFPDDSFTLEGDESSSFDISTSASLDNTLRDLQNSSYPTKAEFNNCKLHLG